MPKAILVQSLEITRSTCSAVSLATVFSSRQRSTLTWLPPQRANERVPAALRAKKNHATMLKSTRDFGMFDAYKTALERASSLASRV
jgi:hypothetical protein